MEKGSLIASAVRSGARLIDRVGAWIAVTDDEPKSPTPAGSPVGDWLRARQGRWAPFLDQGSVGNRRLVAVLGLALGILAILGLPELLAAFVWGNDIEIPLRAAQRWSSGGLPYPPSAMQVYSGGDLPFLYPPFLLPLLGPLSHLPHDLVSGAWMSFTAAVAAWTARRLALPWVAVPFVLAWPPFAEGIITGNVQILHFAAFVALLYVPGVVAPIQKRLLPGRDLVNGVEALGVGFLKVTQLMPVLYLARRRFRAAVVSAVVLVAIVAVTLPFTGLSIYADWLAQLQRADSPSWPGAGIPLSRLGGIPELLLTAIGVAMILAARGRDAAAWMGIAMIIAAPSMHGYGFLFLLPGLLTLRRDLAIPIAALFLGNYHGYAWWMAAMIVTWMLVASSRWPWLRAASRAPDPLDHAAADPGAAS
jgi:hypothetical protein